MTKIMQLFNGDTMTFDNEETYLDYVKEHGKRGVVIGDMVKVLDESYDVDYYHSHDAGTEGKVITIDKYDRLAVEVSPANDIPQYHTTDNVEAVHMTGDGYVVEKGMYLIGNSRNRYGITKEGVIVEVVGYLDDGRIRASIHDSEDAHAFKVVAEMFDFIPASKVETEKETEDNSLIGRKAKATEKANERYRYTTTDAELVVIDEDEGGIKVKIISHKYYEEKVGNSYWVNPEHFTIVDEDEDESPAPSKYGLHEVLTVIKTGHHHFNRGDQVVKIGERCYKRLSDGLSQFADADRFEPSTEFKVGGYAIAKPEADKYYRYTNSAAKLKVTETYASDFIRVLIEEATGGKHLNRYKVAAECFIPAISQEQLDAIKNDDYSLYATDDEQVAKIEEVQNGSAYEMTEDFTDEYGDTLKEGQYVVVESTNTNNVYFKRKASGKQYEVPKDKLSQVAELIALPLSDY